MEWKGVITKISDVDAAGNVTAVFDVFDDKGTLKYPVMSTTGVPNIITSNITTIIRGLMDKNTAAKGLVVGQEIIVSDVQAVK